MDKQCTWTGSRKRKRLRITAAILCICLLAASRPELLAELSVRAMGDRTVYVSGFGELPEAVRAQTVPLGTGEGELSLPDTLEAFAAVAESGDLSEDTDGEDAGQPGDPEGGSENQPGDSEGGSENQPGDSEEGNENQPENSEGEDGNQQEEEDANQPEEGAGEQGAAGSGNSEDGKGDDAGGQKAVIPRIQMKVLRAARIMRNSLRNLKITTQQKRTIIRMQSRKHRMRVQKDFCMHPAYREAYLPCPSAWRNRQMRRSL